MSAKIISNIDQLAEAIGSYKGMMKALDEESYVNSLIDDAFIKTLPAFNEAAVSKGMRDPTTFGHMWEFGTSGITRGKQKYASGLNPASQLWEPFIIKNGKAKTITFRFKDAKSFVPPHTEEDLGVSQDVLDRLKLNTGERRYKFPNKAAIFETGVDVTVAPKRSKKMFVPTKIEGVPAVTKDKFAARERGYAWIKGSHTYNPSHNLGSDGAFTGFFGSWWAGPGSEAMFAVMAAKVETDLISTDKTIKPNKKMTPVQMSRLQAAVTRGETKTHKQFTLKTRQTLGERAYVVL